MSEMTELTMKDLRMPLELLGDFKSLESETFRRYRFPGNEEITINRPVALRISDSGGHYIVDATGFSHYIPKGWIHLTWSVKPGMNHLDF